MAHKYKHFKKHVTVCLHCGTYKINVDKDTTYVKNQIEYSKEPKCFGQGSKVKLSRAYVTVTGKTTIC